LHRNKLFLHSKKIDIRKVAYFYKLYGGAKFEGHIANITPTFSTYEHCSSIKLPAPVA